MTTSPINVTLTRAERDAIDGAKGRIRRLAVLVSHVLESDDELLSDDEFVRPALADVLDVVVEDVGTITEALAAADQRRPARRDTSGGPR
jgi:hypothetical protein